MDKNVGAYLIEDVIVMQAYSQTIDGIWVLDGNVFSAKITEYEKIGNNILNAFGETKYNLSRDFGLYSSNKLLNELLKFLKLKTYKKLMEISKRVTIEIRCSISSNQVLFTPNKLENFKLGYSNLEDKILRSEINSIELGHMLIKAFEFSENHFLEN